MSKRKSIFLFLGFWIITCLGWFYYITKRDDQKETTPGKAAASAVSPATAVTNPVQAGTAEPVPQQYTGSATDVVSDTAAPVIATAPTSSSPQPEETTALTTSEAEEKKTEAGDHYSNVSGAESNSVSATDKTITKAATVGAVYFSYNSTKKITHKNFSKRLLVQISTAIKKTGNKLLITGHSDNIGSDEYNTQLGLERAEKIKRYLVQRGIPAQAIEVSSRGEADPVSNNQTGRGRAKNRRAEITIIS